MIWVVAILLLVVVYQFFYIRLLRKEIRAYQDTWTEIECITDHNKDGDIVIHAREIK